MYRLWRPAAYHKACVVVNWRQDGGGGVFNAREYSLRRLREMDEMELAEGAGAASVARLGAVGLGLSFMMKREGGRGGAWAVDQKGSWAVAHCSANACSACMPWLLVRRAQDAGSWGTGNWAVNPNGVNRYRTLGLVIKRRAGVGPVAGIPGVVGGPLLAWMDQWLDQTSGGL